MVSTGRGVGVTGASVAAGSSIGVTSSGSWPSDGCAPGSVVGSVAGSGGAVVAVSAAGCSIGVARASCPGCWPLGV